MLAIDPGVGAYDGSSAWFRDTGAHNAVTFYESDSSSKTINGYDTQIEDVFFSTEIDYARINADDTTASKTYQYKRHTAFVKNGFDFYVVWDDIENSSRRARYNLHTVSKNSVIDGNKITANCYNNMQLETTFAKPAQISPEIEWGRTEGGYPKVLTNLSEEPVQVAEHLKVSANKNEDFLTVLYPKKNSEQGLTTTDIDVQNESVEAFKVTKSNGAAAYIIINNADSEQTFALNSDVKDMMNGDSFTENVKITIGAKEMRIFKNADVPDVVPEEIHIDGAETIFIPTSGTASYDFYADVIDNFGNIIPKSEVVWSVEPSESITIDAGSGVLTLQPDIVQGTVIPVSATVKGTDIHATLYVAAELDSTVASVEIVGPDEVAIPSAGTVNTIQYQAVFKDRFGKPVNGVRALWQTQNDIPGVTLNSVTGELMISENAARGTKVELKVQSTSNGKVAKSLFIRLDEAKPTAIKYDESRFLQIPDSGEMQKQFTAYAVDQNGMKLEGFPVVWTLVQAPKGVSITEDGLLTLTEDVTDGAKISIRVSLPTHNSVQEILELTAKKQIAAKVTITGPSEVAAEKTGSTVWTYKGTIYSEEGREIVDDNLIWSLSKSIDGISLQDGRLTVSSQTMGGEITIRASASSDESIYADYNISVMPADKTGTGGSGGGNSGGGGTSPGTSPITPVSPLPNVPVESERFVDIANVAWAKDAIYALADKGIINGVGNGRFEPLQSVTREQFVKMILEAFGIRPENGTVSFRDADPQAWYYGYLVSAENMGLIQGYEDGRFGVSEKISRQEMAALAYRAALMFKLEFTDGNTDAFRDEHSIADYAKDAVKILQANGIMNGRDDGSFDPGSNASRAEAAVVIYKLLNIPESDGEANTL